VVSVTEGTLAKETVTLTVRNVTPSYTESGAKETLRL
jgi:hypothetical protein